MVMNFVSCCHGFYCLVLNVYGLYATVKVQNYCLESDFLIRFLYICIILKKWMDGGCLDSRTAS